MRHADTTEQDRGQSRTISTNTAKYATSAPPASSSPIAERTGEAPSVKPRTRADNNNNNRKVRYFRTCPFFPFTFPFPSSYPSKRYSSTCTTPDLPATQTDRHIPPHRQLPCSNRNHPRLRSSPSVCVSPPQYCTLPVLTLHPHHRSTPDSNNPRDHRPGPTDRPTPPTEGVYGGCGNVRARVLGPVILPSSKQARWGASRRVALALFRSAMSVMSVGDLGSDRQGTGL